MEPSGLEPGPPGCDPTKLLPIVSSSRRRFLVVDRCVSLSSPICAVAECRTGTRSTVCVPSGAASARAPRGHGAAAIILRAVGPLSPHGGHSSRHYWKAENAGAGGGPGVASLCCCKYAVA